MWVDASGEVFGYFARPDSHTQMCHQVGPEYVYRGVSTTDTR